MSAAIGLRRTSDFHADDSAATNSNSVPTARMKRPSGLSGNTRCTGTATRRVSPFSVHVVVTPSDQSASSSRPVKSARRANACESAEGNGDDAVVPREVVYPPDQTTEEVEQENAQAFANSLSSAQEAALRELGYPPAVAIGEIADDSPNAGVIKTGDVITAVDGQSFDSPEALERYQEAKRAYKAKLRAESS